MNKISKLKQRYKEKENIMLKVIPFTLVLIVLMISVGYSAFSQKLEINDITATIRIQSDIRITGITVSNDENFNTNGGVSYWEDYNVKHIQASINFPEKNSQIKYKVQITNFGNTEMGILKITGLPENLEYKLDGYNLEEKICVEKQCKLGIQKDIYIIIKYKYDTELPNNTNFTIDLDFEFKPFHKVTYTNFDIDTDKYPQEVIEGATFKMNLTEPFPIGAKPFYDSEELSYRFENDTLVVDNIINDLEIKSNYIQSIEDLVTLSNYVNNGKNYKGITFILDKNLDFLNKNSYRNAERTDFGNINGINNTESLLNELTNQSGTGFKSIGNYTYHFEGSLDGHNHTIDNIYIHSYSNNSHPERTVVSLFGFITDGEIKNLTIKGTAITEENANVGGITSYASNVLFDNVHNYVNITSHGTGYSVGGLIGGIGNDNIGLKGDNVRITNCSNHSTLQGGNHGGGLVGAVGTDAHLFVNNSYNAGKVINSIITDSGIIALNNGNCYINNSYNIGDISTNGKGTDTGIISLGGLVAANYETIFIVNSYNKGNITYTGTAASNGSIGGLVGLIQGGGHILNSYNGGTIKDNTTHNYVGGIANTVTWNNPVHKQVYNVYNYGNITGGKTKYQIGYLYNGDLKTSYYKSGTGITGSNVNGSSEMSDNNMKLIDESNSNSLIYKLNNGIKNIDLNTIINDLINHDYNRDYFDLSLDNWIIDSESGYPTLKR